MTKPEQTRHEPVTERDGYCSVQVTTGDDLLPRPGIDDGVTAAEVLRG